MDPLESQEQAVVDATVQFFDFEGGCWAITVADRFHYLPMNLPEQFRRHGLDVRAELKRRDDMLSYCFTPVVEIITIRTR